MSSHPFSPPPKRKWLQLLNNPMKPLNFKNDSKFDDVVTEATQDSHSEYLSDAAQDTSEYPSIPTTKRLRAGKV